MRVENATRPDSGIPSAYRSLARQAGLPLSEILEMAAAGNLAAAARRAETRNRRGIGITSPAKARAHLARRR